MFNQIRIARETLQARGSTRTDSVEAERAAEEQLLKRTATYARHRKTIHQVLSALGDALLGAGHFRVEERDPYTVSGEPQYFRAALRQLGSTPNDLLYVEVTAEAEAVAVLLNSRLAHGSKLPRLTSEGFSQEAIARALTRLIEVNDLVRRLGNL